MADAPRTPSALPDRCPKCGRESFVRLASGECYFAETCVRPPDLDDLLEQAFWRFDALHKAHYRDVAPNALGPLSERDAFKGTVRWLVLDVLGHHAGES